MFSILIYYIALPFLASAALISFLRRAGGPQVPGEIRELWARDPPERRSFRALRVTGRFGRPGLAIAKLGDFETQPEAVDAVYQGREADRSTLKGDAASGSPGSAAVAARASAAYIVLNDRGEILEQI